MSKHPDPRLDTATLAATWQSASLLLGYPDDRLLNDVPLLQQAARGLPPALGVPLQQTADALAATAGEELQADYVATFDSRRRTNLFLTYFAHGDTRKRGLALLRFKQTYLRSGFVLDADEATGGELPDHLCVVLEYGACVDQRLGWRLLLDHRAGLELLRLALESEQSRWAGAVQAVCATLPQLTGDDRDVIARLALEGPPAEEVGMTPYGTPGFDAVLTDVREGALS